MVISLDNTSRTPAMHLRHGWVGRLGEAMWKDGSGPTTVDVCAGGGGLSLGFYSAGFRVVAALEIDAVAATTHRSNFPDSIVFGPGDGRDSQGDLTKVTGGELLKAIGLERGQLGLLMGGLPCQGFSLMGNRLVSDPRNWLYLDFVRLIDELRPEAYFIENVPAMESIDDGSIFNDLLARLRALGYSATSSVINAATYGVPQLRTRLFVVGRRDGVAVKLPSGPLDEARYTTVQDAIHDLPSDLSQVPMGGPFELPYASKASSHYARLMRGSSTLVTNCVPTHHDEEVKSRLRALAPGETEPMTRHRRLDPSRPAWTLRAGSRTRTACRPIHPNEPRVITIREAARLGSFPDEFEFPQEKAPAHMLIGNSVPPLLAHHLAVQLTSLVFRRDARQ